jgi:hypothetical protein
VLRVLNANVTAPQSEEVVREAVVVGGVVATAHKSGPER